jgi:hypothetical protein
VTEITAAEDKAKQAERERFDKLVRLERQLRELDKLNAQAGFKDGPAHDFSDALSRGNLPAAEAAIDELRKKAKNKQLTPEDQKQLAQQLDRMQDELQRLSRNKEQQEKLEELIRKAKEEGRDAEALERELNRLKLDAEQLKSLEDLAQKLRDARNSLKGEDLEKLAKDLERVKGQLGELQGEVEDLKELQDQIARLQELKDEMGRRAKPGEAGDSGDAGVVQPGVRVRRAGAAGGGPGSGARPENPNAPTARGADERQRSPFDPRGRKAYGGATTGPAFTKRSPVDMSGAIEQAVQEAPEAIDSQRLSRDDKEAVKEFFQSLGNQKR